MLDALTSPWLDPASRTFAGALLTAAAVAWVFGCVQWRASPWAVLRRGVGALFSQLATKSSALDIQLLLGRQLLRVLGALPALGASLFVAQWSVRSLDRWFGIPDLGVPAIAVMIAYTAALFVAWDASRFAVHRLLHAVPALWAFHQVHHSAEVLTPLTFHRVHPIESALYQLRGALVTTAVLVPFFWLFRGAVTEWTVLGVHGVGFVLNSLTGNLRHSHVWMRFGPAVERWLISPAQHQLHHSLDAQESQSNYGTWLAIWDRLMGSLLIASDRAPQAYGVVDANHQHTLLSAWFSPFVDAFRAIRPQAALPALAAMALVPLLSSPSSAEDEPEEDDDSDGEVIVEAEAGLPTVAGSAHILDEEDLDRLQHDDIHRLIADVPGMNIREEDGFGLRPNIGIRGAASERSAKITLLEDGIPFAPAPYAAPAAYFFPLATRMVGLEVFKGPAATQHGPNTIGGAVNLKTREVPRSGPDAAVDGAIGRFGTHRLHTWAGTGNDQRGLLIEGVQLGSNGFKTLPDDGFTGFERSELMVKGRLVIRDDDRATDTLVLKLGYARERSHETYLGLHRDDWEEAPYQRYASTTMGLMQWNRTQAEATWVHRRSSGMTVRTTAYHHYLRRAWTKFNQFADGPSPHEVLLAPDRGVNALYLALLRGEADSNGPTEQLKIGTNDRTFHSSGVQSTARFELRGSDDLVARGEVGLRLHHDHVQRLHTEDAYDMSGGALQRADAPTETTMDRVTTATAIAAHTHWDARWTFLHLQPGLRVEAVRTQLNPASAAADPAQYRLYVMPGLGALANVGEFMDVFAGVHRGFSPVSPGQPVDTRAEQALNYEVGARLARYDLKADFTGFYSNYQNLVGQCSIAGGCLDQDVDLQFNAGKVQILGVESSVRHEVPLSPTVSIPMNATYTLTHTRFMEPFQSSFPQFGSVLAGDAMPYIPTHQGSVGTGIHHERATLDLGAELRSSMYDSASNPDQDVAEVPPLALVHASAQAQISGPLWLTLSAQNLTNRKTIVSWRPAGIRPTAPRQIMIGVRVRGAQN